MRRRSIFAHIVSCLIPAVCSCALAGCGRGAAEQQPEYHLVQSEWEALFQAGNGGDEEIFLGMQYYGDEPVQLWTKGGNMVYMRRKDGSRDVLLEDAERVGTREWFPEGEDAVYCWSRDWALGENEEVKVVQHDSSGAVLQSWRLAEGMAPEDICRLQDGRIMVLLKDEREGSRRLGALDSGSDTVSLSEGIRLELTADRWYITAGEEGLLVLDTGMAEGITEIDLEDGSRLRTIAYPGIVEKTFSLEAEPEEMVIQDFRMSAEGSPEILWADPVSGEGIRESLLLTKIDREVIVLRTFAAGSWLKEKIVEFNLLDEEYYIVLEERPKGTDRNDYASQTSIQLAAGKGPDILYGDILTRDCFRGLTGKGVFEDLAPLLEGSGIKEKDYFPFTFQYWRNGEKIYTVCAAGAPFFYYVDSSVVAEEPDIRTLTAALQSYGEEAYFEFMLADQMLAFFLRGSQDFWGMIDWEQRTCDFNNELFAGILEAVRRYSCEEGEIVGVPDRPFLAGAISCGNLYEFDSAEEMRERGRIRAGVQFDDGCHAVMNSSYLAIVKGTSSHREGAWRFISYLLQEDTQMTIWNKENGNWNEVPSNKGALRGIIQADLAYMAENGREKYINQVIVFPDGEQLTIKDKRYRPEEITEERIAEYTALLEGARAFPADTAPLLDLICEEAKYYIDGAKNFEDTAEVINNRVGLYLREH